MWQHITPSYSLISLLIIINTFNLLNGWLEEITHLWVCLIRKTESTKQNNIRQNNPTQDKYFWYWINFCLIRFFVEQNVILVLCDTKKWCYGSMKEFFFSFYLVPCLMFVLFLKEKCYISRHNTSRDCPELHGDDVLHFCDVFVPFFSQIFLVYY